MYYWKILMDPLSTSKRNTSGGLAKSSKPIKSQHSYHVTFFPKYRPKYGPKCIRNASKVFRSYPNFIRNASQIIHAFQVECILPALYHIGEGGWGREGALSKGSLSYNNAFRYDAYLTYSNTVKIPNLSQMYQKCIPNSNKNTVFLQNKPTIYPETNQISSIHCKK